MPSVAMGEQWVQSSKRFSWLGFIWSQQKWLPLGKTAHWLVQGHYKKALMGQNDLLKKRILHALMTMPWHTEIMLGAECWQPVKGNAKWPSPKGKVLAIKSYFFLWLSFILLDMASFHPEFSEELHGGGWAVLYLPVSAKECHWPVGLIHGLQAPLKKHGWASSSSPPLGLWYYQALRLD